MRVFLTALIMLSLTGCATIVTGGGQTQTVSFTSEPRGAKIYVDENLVGMTPVAAVLMRHEKHNVRAEMDGFEPQAALIKSNGNGWILGNIVFGGIVGVIVDCVSGAQLGDLSPKHFNLVMKLGGPPKEDPDTFHFRYKSPSEAEGKSP